MILEGHKTSYLGESLVNLNFQEISENLKTKRSQHIKAKDGLRTVSQFLEKTRNRKEKKRCSRMGCGLDTRPAALACLRIIIAALNILIAVSSSFFYKHHKRFNLLECSLMGNNQGPIEYCKIFIESRLLILGIFLFTFFSCQILIFLLDSSPLIVLIVCSSQFFFRLNLDFLPPPAAAASSCWDSGSN